MRTESRLKIVPDSDAEFLFGPIEELILFVRAVVILGTDAKPSSVICDPLPTSLQHKVAAEVDFFAQMDVRRDERHVMVACRPAPTVLRAELKLPRLGEVINERLTRFTIQTQLIGRIDGASQHN